MGSVNARVLRIIDFTDPDKPVLLGHAVGRAAIMHALLLAYGDRINAMLAGSMVFDFGQGEKVKPRVIEHLEGN